MDSTNIEMATATPLGHAESGRDAGDFDEAAYLRYLNSDEGKRRYAKTLDQTRSKASATAEAAIFKDFIRRCGGSEDRARKLFDTMQIREPTNHDRCKIGSPKQRKRTCDDGVASIDYFDMDGHKTDVSRLRMADDAKPKYLSYDGVPPHAYLTPGINWREIAADPVRDLITTEVEISAAVACLFGYNCIGIPGIWAWKSKRAGFDLLPELEQFIWTGRKVTIIYDSDICSKPQVKGALHALARELAKRAAVVRTKTLPSEPEQAA